METPSRSPTACTVRPDSRNRNARTLRFLADSISLAIQAAPLGFFFMGGIVYLYFGRVKLGGLDKPFSLCFNGFVAPIPGVKLENDMATVNVIEASRLLFKISGKPCVAVLSVEDAAAKWDKYRLACGAAGLGCSDIGNGGVVYDGRKIVARISYNGQMWS